MPKLFMILLGCTPTGRNIEQHDVFFGVGEKVGDLVPDISTFWPGANKLHLDAWREVTRIDGYKVEIASKGTDKTNNPLKLFFLNLGGYKHNEFEEFHYKMIMAATDKGEAIDNAKQTAFFRHTGFPGANSHIDDKYGVDVDDVYEISDILPVAVKERYSILVRPAGDDSVAEDEMHLGYFKLTSFQ